MTAAEVREALGLKDEYAHWLEELERAAPSPAPAPMPPDPSAALRLLNAPADDIPVLLAHAPDSEALRWIVDREHAVLTSTMGQPTISWWPSLRGTDDPATELVHIWAFLATLDAVRAFHDERGIPEDVSWATLGDLGQNLHENHLFHDDEVGLDVPWWITLHFRGAIYQLGRLQFERRVLRGNIPGTTADDTALGVHIPEIGPMTPQACDASIAWAHEFFPKHFAEEDPRVATCSSWLLDPQLADYLPADSNIVRFQRRFTLRPDKTVADNGSICRFVFHDPNPDLDAVPQETTLQRAIVQHIKDGGTWQSANGYFEW